VHGNVDAVSPDANILESGISFDAVVRCVEDVVAENIHVSPRRRNPVSHVGDAVVRDRVIRRRMEIDALSAEALRGVRGGADDRVVGDIPSFATGPEVNPVQVVDKARAADDDVR
jgi:hypothetical protein